MSNLRPTLKNAAPGTFTPRDGTAYLMVLRAVEDADGLIHGKLHDHGEHCAIGNYFERHANTALPSPLIDEVTAVNDSVPNYSPRRRRLFVARWLRWKLATLGMTEFNRAKKPA